jgi:hypothetical protein
VQVCSLHWKISWLLSLDGEGKAWPGPQPHSHMVGHSWRERHQDQLRINKRHSCHGHCPDSIPMR